MYDHAHGKDDFETDEELDDICAQITFKNIFLEKEDPIYFDSLTYWQELWPYGIESLSTECQDWSVILI